MTQVCVYFCPVSGGCSWCLKFCLLELTQYIYDQAYSLCSLSSQEPLNSGDDVSDEEDQELFDTENVVVCQYDKVRVCRMSP